MLRYTMLLFLLLISSFLMLIAFERRCMKTRRRNENSIRKINGKIAFTINQQEAAEIIQCNKPMNHMFTSLRENVQQ